MRFRLPFLRLRRLGGPPRPRLILPSQRQHYCDPPPVHLWQIGTLWRRFRRFCAEMRDEQRVPAERFERD